MSRVLAFATFFSFACATVLNGQLSFLDTTSGSQDILQTIMDGLSTASPSVEKIASGLMDNYQQTLEGVLTTFTDTVNSAGALKEEANDQITSTTAEVVGSTQSTIKAALDAANEVYAKITDSSMPVIGQVANGAKYIQQSAEDAVAQVKELYATYEDAYCMPAEYTPPANVPANLTGPGFTLTFSVGNCTFVDKELLSKDGAIECVGPSVTLDSTPATFTSAYISAAKFVGEQCEISKSFGETKTEVLYVFDPKELATQQTPLSDIAQYLEQELSDVLSSIGINPFGAAPTTAPEVPVGATLVAVSPQTVLREVVVAKAPETPVADILAAISPQQIAATGPVAVVTVSPPLEAASPAAEVVATVVPATPTTAAAIAPDGVRVVTVPSLAGSATAPEVRVLLVPAPGGR